MDSLDRDIIACLKENSRMRASEIGKRVNLSVSSVIDRMRKLEDQGIILRYTTVLDQKKLGQELMVMVGIKLEQPRFCDSFIESIMQDSHIFSCLYLTGELDFLLKITASSPQELQEVHYRISTLPGVAMIKSYFVLKEIKNDLYDVGRNGTF